MRLEDHWRTEYLLGNRRRRWIPPLRVVFVFALLIGFSASAQAPPKIDVLILNEVDLSHSLTNVMTHQILTGVREKPGRPVEFFSESLDLISYPGRLSPPEMRESLARKYGDRRLTAVVAIGPDTIRFLSNYSDTLFPEVPIVICGSAEDQAGNPSLDSRFTGTWEEREPGKTVEAALRLFPNTRRVFVVGGSSVYDHVVMTATKEFLSSFPTKVEFSYLDDMEMERLLERLRNLPENSVVFYISFFQDSAGKKFLNATQALPMIASTANAPVFGMSDTYLGHGIVGGDVMNFQEQGKVTARIVSELLDGKKPADIPIKSLPSMLMFDWNELKRWHISENTLPSGSIIVFREPSFWERTKWIWGVVFLLILGFSVLGVYLKRSQNQLKVAREGQMELSGMLINAAEQERHRIAAELHDDFSQRLAVLSLGLENVDEAMPDSFTVVHNQMRGLINSTSELGVDLHTLSHQLHSSTLESLGLVPAVAALCKEFTAQQCVKVDFTSDEIPRSLQPETALCVFRIVQEGLRNLKKHSGAAEALVNLSVRGDRLLLTIRDEGCGFDSKLLRQDKGIGIRTMEERVRLLSGEFRIHSVRGKGTTLEARVPFRLESGNGKS
jgi:signal transduction histidine kinase